MCLFVSQSLVFPPVARLLKSERYTNYAMVVVSSFRILPRLSKDFELWKTDVRSQARDFPSGVYA